ncbi:translation initiation factor IF-1A [archaeon]|nr:MAG: translation initiation factor IF-1A [archaeon]RLG65705.1 MAG: translation initiation factor IF-1A [archaeon]HDM23550.1 translation initiation factor IF-1A [Candidatus Bathyarchaeota archaeon]
MSRRRRKRKAKAEAETGKLRVPMEGEMLAKVLRKLGGKLLEVLCEDGEIRICRIAGHLQRRFWIKVGDIVLVAPWEFQPSRCDLLYRYDKTELRRLKAKGYIKDETFMEVTEGFM